MMQPTLPYIYDTKLPTNFANAPECTDNKHSCTDWHTVSVRDIAAKTRNALASGPFGSNLGIADYTNEGIPVIRGQNLNYGSTIGGTYVYIDEQKAKQLKANQALSNDIIFTQRGTIGQVALVPAGDFECYIISQSQMKLTVDAGKALPRFVHAYFSSPLGQKYLITSTIQTGLPHINLGILARAMLPLPPLTEQARIVEILDAADAAVRTTENLIEAKLRYKHALAEQLLTEKRRFPEFKGQAWQQYRLGELFTERIEMNRPDLKLLAVTGTEGIVDRDSLVKRDTSSEDKSKYLRVAPGDIAYNTMRMWQGVFGLSALEGIVSPAYTVCTPNERIDGHFAAYLFKLPATIALFHRHSQGLVSDTLNCKFPSFAKIKVTIPPIPEQRIIADVLGLVDEEITLLRQELNALKRQKQGLMQKLLSGEVRVKEFAP